MIRLTPDEELRKFENLEEFTEVLPHLKKATQLAQDKIREITQLYGKLSTQDAEFEMLKSRLIGPVAFWRERMQRFGVRALENWSVEVSFTSGKVQQFILSEE